MDCEAFQAELPDMIYGELHEDAREGVEQHLASCARCAELTGELKAVRAALTQTAPPPLLQARVKLAARDHLLEAQTPDPGPFTLGGSFHLVAAVILAACIGLAGFGLGVAYQRAPETPAPSSSPSLPLPENPADVPDRPPPWVDPVTGAGGSELGPGPRAPEAWQRVLLDAGGSRLAEQDYAQAREFFRRAAAVAPQGPLAAAARVGVAECSLRLGRVEEAGRILSEVEAAVRGGELEGGARLLQRIHELRQEVQDDF